MRLSAFIAQTSKLVSLSCQNENKGFQWPAIENGINNQFSLCSCKLLLIGILDGLKEYAFALPLGTTLALRSRECSDFCVNPSSLENESRVSG